MLPLDDDGLWNESNIYSVDWGINQKNEKTASMHGSHGAKDFCRRDAYHIKNPGFFYQCKNHHDFFLPIRSSFTPSHHSNKY